MGRDVLFTWTRDEVRAYCRHNFIPVERAEDPDLPLAHQTRRTRESNQGVVGGHTASEIASRGASGQTSDVRKQYHFWPGADGVDAWDVDRLIDMSAELAAEEVPV